MEVPLILHRITGGHREAYYEAITSLPEFNRYQPSYITMGPTGKCNVVCPDCIIGGAIFIKERQQLHRGEDVLPFLEAAERAGVERVSFCAFPRPISVTVRSKSSVETLYLRKR